MYKIKHVHYFYNLGFDSIKFIWVFLRRKLLINGSKKKVIKIKSKKTGEKNLIIRPYTTDFVVAKKMLLENGEYDFLYKSEYDWIKKSKIIIDAGANIGVFSRIIREINKDAFIVAIEPEKDNYQILKDNLTYDNCDCIQKGLWNKKCNLIINPSETGEWGFTVSETKKKGDIEAIGISDILEKYNFKHIDILKIDIEGSEYEVFDETCEEWIEKVTMFIIEFHDGKKEGCSKRILEKMKKHGFKQKKHNENYVFIKEL